MNKILLLSFVLFIGSASSLAQSVELPRECERILDKNFRGWKLAKIQKDIIDWHQKNNFPYSPNLMKGDWNGDGKIDYAVLIEHGKLKNSYGEIIEDRRLTIAFVRSGRSFKYFRFDGGDYISFIRKGSKGYDYETDKNFLYKKDAISDGFWEKAGVSYVWENGRFKTIVTSD